MSTQHPLFVTSSDSACRNREIVGNLSDILVAKCTVEWKPAKTSILNDYERWLKELPVNVMCRFRSSLGVAP